MKTRMRVAVAIFAGAGIIAAGGGGAALASSGTPATTHATASTQAATAKTPKYVVLDCRFKPVVAPSTERVAREMDPCRRLVPCLCGEPQARETIFPDSPDTSRQE